MSCNGCRVLRKRCSDNCTLRSCLQWIDGAEAQGHATAFVAKYFGRAGLTNFIASVPPTQRPALFRSLFYEACGRIVNPVHGAVGLLCSGDWQVCQDAAEMVLSGKTLQPLSCSPSQTSHDPSATHPNQQFSTLPLLEHASAETVLFDQTNDLHIEHSSFAIAPSLRMSGLDCRERFHESESRAMKTDHQTDLQSERDDELQNLPKKPLKRKLLQPSEATPRSPPAAGVEAFCEAIYRAGLEGEAAAESAVVLDLTLSSHPLAHSKRRHKAATKMAAPGSNSVSSEGSVTSLDHTPGLAISQVGAFLPLNH